MQRHFLKRLVALLPGVLLTLTSNSQMTPQVAEGTFVVQMTPVADTTAGPLTLGELQVTKTFLGGLTGTGTGRMLTALTPEEGSAGYVLIEVVTGTLQGKTGGFALQHSGLMDLGSPALTIAIVPGSGSGELVGIRGTFGLEIVEGEHRYTLRYTLPG